MAQTLASNLSAWLCTEGEAGEWLGTLALAAAGQREGPNLTVWECRVAHLDREARLERQRA